MPTTKSTRSRSRSPKIPIDQMREHVGEVSNFLKTLSNETRLLVLCTLLEGEQSVGELNGHIELSASALSQHLAWLREAGLVATRREAQTIYYRINDPRVMAVIMTLKQQFCS